MTAFDPQTGDPQTTKPLHHKEFTTDYFGRKCASSSSGARTERSCHDVTERKAQDSQRVKVPSGETPGSLVARLPVSVERPAAKRSNNTSLRGWQLAGPQHEAKSAAS
jgi:hypothetical protein